MSVATPRMRMFAGPNGSGKSTMKDLLRPEWLGVYVNADEIEKGIRQHGCFDPAEFVVSCTGPELQAFLLQSTLLSQADLLPQVPMLKWTGGKLQFDGVEVNSYWASVLADFIRHKLLASKTSFTFETVMSSPDKVDFLHKAQQAGFRTYLYYVATEDPEINISRVSNRVKQGGHPVPEDKIRKRYLGSLALLPQAVAFADRAFIFDNSSHAGSHILVAEVTHGEEVEMKTDSMPYWFKSALWDKLGGD